MQEKWRSLFPRGDTITERAWSLIELMTSSIKIQRGMKSVSEGSDAGTNNRLEESVLDHDVLDMSQYQ